MMRWLLTLLMILTTVSGARADSWGPPERERFLSPDRSIQLIVLPDRPGKFPREGHHPATGTLERRERERGRWVKVWDSPLANEVAPVSALVADGGEYVVTFDNWGSVGAGSDVVVIYRRDGSRVRSLRLLDLLPRDYLEGLPRSFSSIDWRNDERLDLARGRLVLSIVVPDEDQTRVFGRGGPAVSIEVDLKTGVVLPTVGSAWEAARAKARAVATARREAIAAYRVAFSAPLRAPTSDDEQSWEAYAREAYERLDPASEENHAAVVILRDPGARDYAASEAKVRETLTGSGIADVTMLAAPGSPDRLASIVAQGSSRLKPGALKGKRFYVAVPEQQAWAITASLQVSGAEVTAIDLSKPIPQRPERLQRQAEADRLEAEADALEAMAEAEAAPK